MSILDVQLLGGFRLMYAGRDVKAIQSERLALLLSHLLLNAETPSSRKQVAFLFWPDTSEEQARTNLRNLFHHLKKAFPEIDSFLDIEGQSIRWRADASIQLDVKQFRDSLAQAKSSKEEQARIRHLQEAVSSYRGELLPGFYEDWILVQREELHQAFLNALTQLTKLFEDSRQYDEAIEAVNRLIRSDPLNESAYQLSMRLHALNNDRAGALQVYHTCSTVLMQELGMEPSSEVKALYEQLIRTGNGSAVQKEQAPDARKLIGRKQEWGQIREAWQSILKGKPGLVVILGEAGIGKSRLANEMAQWTRRQGIITASAQCYPLEGNLSFAPVVTWLRTTEIQEEMTGLEPLWKKELSRLLPEHETEELKAVKGDQKWQRQRLFEALAKGLLGSGTPRLLILDDAQWGDQETLEFIHYLLRYDVRAPLMVLATARIEELESSHPLNQLRLTLQAKDQFKELELAPLNKMELGLLARDVTGKELSEKKQDELYTETEGNPFFTVEMLRSAGNDEAQIIPQSLRSVLAHRLNQLSASARELAGFAATIGREFNYRLLANASQVDENTLVQALDELWSRRIIQAQQADTYNFTHGKLRDAAYETLTHARRQIFHRRIAGALLAEAEQGFEVQNAIIAQHFEKVGQYQQAVDQYLKAASAARQVFANPDAISHLERALRLLSEKVGIKEEAQRQQERESRELLGDIYEISSNGKRALETYSEALTQIASSERLDRARMLGKIAKVAAHEGDIEDGKKFFAQAEDVLGEPPSDTEKEWWYTWLKIQFDRVWMYYDFGVVEGIEAALGPIRPVVERMGELGKLGEYYFLLPTAYFRRDGFQMNDEIMRYSTLALETSQKTDNLELRTRANFGYGFCNFLLGNFDLAIHYMGEGLKLADQIGYVEQQLYNVTYLAAAHRGAGNLEECKTYSERGLALSEREQEPSFAATARANLGWIAWKQNDLIQAKTLSQKATMGWSRYYPFRWYGLWTLIDLSLLSLRTEDAVEYARMLKAPGQQVFAKEGDDLLAGAIEAADKGETARAESLLMKAVEWAKKNHYL